MNLVKRLRLLNCKVLLPEHLGSEVVEAEAATVPKRFWTLGRNAGSALHLSQREMLTELFTWLVLAVALILSLGK